MMWQWRQSQDDQMNLGSIWRLEKAKKWIIFQSVQKEDSSAGNLILTGETFWPPDL